MAEWCEESLTAEVYWRYREHSGETTPAGLGRGRAMRIAVVNKLLVPSGGFRWSKGWTSGLIELGHSTTAVFLREARTGASLKRSLQSIPHEIYLVGRWARLSETLMYPIVRRWLMDGFGKESAPDPLNWIAAPFVHDWSRYELIIAYEEYTALAALAANRLFGIPYVVFFQESYSNPESAVLADVLRKWRILVSMRAKLLVANSAKVAQSYESLLGRRVYAIPHGCFPDASPPDKKETFVLADTRWTEVRNPLFLVEIARRTPNIHYLMTSTFPTDEHKGRFINAVNRLGLGERIHLLPPELDEEELAGYYRSAMAYVRWSAHKGDSLVESGLPFGIFQALSHACPPIVNREITTDPSLNGRLDDFAVELDPSEFAERINWLTKGDNLDTAARQAYTLAITWRWRNRANALLRLLEGAS